MPHLKLGFHVSDLPSKTPSAEEACKTVGGAVVKGKVGRVASPNLGHGPFAESLHCQWRIVVPEPYVRYYCINVGILNIVYENINVI